MGTYRSSKGNPTEFRAVGASLTDLFETCAQATFDLLYDTSLVGFEREVSVVASGPDLENLLARWIGETMSLLEEKEFVPGDFIVVEVGLPTNRRYGDDNLIVRSAVRGRFLGEWFADPGRRAMPIDAKDVRITSNRRKHTANVRVTLH